MLQFHSRENAESLGPSNVVPPSLGLRDSVVHRYKEAAALKAFALSPEQEKANLVDAEN